MLHARWLVDFVKNLCSIQARRVDSVEGGSFIFWEVYFSSRDASL